MSEKSTSSTEDAAACTVTLLSMFLTSLLFEFVSQGGASMDRLLPGGSHGEMTHEFFGLSLRYCRELMQTIPVIPRYRMQIDVPLQQSVESFRRSLEAFLACQVYGRLNYDIVS